MTRRKTFQHLTGNLSGTVRREKLNGREYLVAPITMVVPGVLAGSKGPLLYPPDVLSRNPSAWNGAFLTLGHPKQDGQAVSSRDPDILRSTALGHIFRAKWTGRKLAAEAWLDVELCSNRDPRIIERVARGEKTEISIGGFTTEEPAPKGATHNGQFYKAVVRDLSPDHVALLLDQRGACSVEDGCGLLANDRPTVKRILSTLNSKPKPISKPKKGLPTMKPFKLAKDAWDILPLPVMNFDPPAERSEQTYEPALNAQDVDYLPLPTFDMGHPSEPAANATGDFLPLPRMEF